MADEKETRSERKNDLSPDIIEQSYNDVPETEKHETLFDSAPEEQETPQQREAFKKELELQKKYGNSEVRTAVESAASAASFGITDQILSTIDKEGLSERRKRNEASALAGEVAGISAAALLSGGESIAAKVLSGGVSTAAKTGAATERLVANALKKVATEKGNKALVQNILRKGIEKSAGLTTEGLYYSSGQLISEEALGKAEFNAENLASTAKEAAVFGALLGTGAAGFSAVVPVFKGNKITNWASQKFKGKKPTDINETAGLTLYMSERGLQNFKKLNPKEYQNLSNYALNDLKVQHLDTARSLAAKNADTIASSTAKLDSLYPQLDDALKIGDETGEALLGTSNAEVADNIIDDIHGWVRENITTKNVNGETVLRAGVDKADYIAALREVKKVEDLFGVNTIKDAMKKKINFESTYLNNKHAAEVQIYNLERKLEQAQAFKTVTKQRTKLADITAQKRQNLDKLSTKVDQIDRTIIETSQKLRATTDKKAQKTLRSKLAKLKEDKKIARLDTKELNSTLERQSQALKKEVSSAPKISASEAELNKELKIAKSKLDDLDSAYNKDIVPLHEEILKLQENLKSPAAASKLREMKQSWSKKGDWKRSSADINFKTKLARSGTANINRRIEALAEAVEATNPNLAKDLLLETRKLSTGIKLADTIDTAATISDNRGIATRLLFAGAVKNVIGTSGALSAVPFVLQSQATYEAMRSIGGANLISRLKLLSNVERSNQTVLKKVTNSIKTFFDKTTKTGKKVSKPLILDSLMKSDLAKTVSDTGSITKPSDSKEAFKNITKNISELVANPEKLMEQSSQIFPDLESAAPMTKQALSTQVAQTVHYLNSKIPKNTTATPNQLIKREWEPSSMELAKFARILKAISDPLSILEDILDGTLARESVEAIKTLKPELYTQIQTKVMNIISTSEDTIPYEKRLILGILLDIESDAALNGLNIAALQQLHTDTQAEQQGGASTFTASKAESLDIAESKQTPTQKAASR